MKTYRVAIVGLGRMASTIDDEGHDIRGYSVPLGGKVSVAASCKASERLELVAGADIDSTKREAFAERWEIDAVYENYMHMIEKERPDMVAVLTNGPLHSEMGVAVANAGVPMLYLEKAMGGSLAEADAVLDACRNNGTLFNQGVLRRFDTRFEAVAKLIARGEIGEPKTAIYYNRTPLLHNKIHEIDTFSYLLGDPLIHAVRGELEPRNLEIKDNFMQEDPNANFEVLFSNGIRGFSIPGGAEEYEVIGSEGAVRIQNGGLEIIVRKTGSSPGLHPMTGLPIPGNWENVVSPSVELTSSVIWLMEDIVNSYETGEPTRSNVDLSHHITEACFAIAESHRRGGVWLELPLKERELYVVHR